MSLGHMLLTRKLIAQEQLDAAVMRQKMAGGRLEDHLIALGEVTQEQVGAIRQEPPHVPQSIPETGLEAPFLLRSILKAMFILGVETIPTLAQHLALSKRIIEELLQMARKEGLVEIRGAVDSSLTVLRYALTGAGRERALEALQRSHYVGPVPVSLADYRSQVQKQTVTNERVASETLAAILSHLVLPQDVLRQLGPAVNSGKPLLLYGPSGNGKTSIAEAIGEAFQQTVYIPYCIEVGGSIIKIFDPVVHLPVSLASAANGTGESLGALAPTDSDPRWVRCRRPVIISGGELTLDMLDLKLDPISHDYEAPLQVKATGGVFVIDDFGRQLVRPRDLLNRWIAPLEKKVDYLTLHTGKKFDVPFDEFIVFSTNLAPEDLMDAAFLRRVHYKLFIGPPSAEDYAALFHRVCTLRGLELPQTVLSYIQTAFYTKTQTRAAAFHPKFIVEHIVSSCAYEGIPPRFTEEMLKDALQNLLIVDENAEG